MEGTGERGNCSGEPSGSESRRGSCGGAVRAVGALYLSNRSIYGSCKSSLAGISRLNTREQIRGVSRSGPFGNGLSVFWRYSANEKLVWVHLVGCIIGI